MSDPCVECEGEEGSIVPCWQPCKACQPAPAPERERRVQSCLWGVIDAEGVLVSLLHHTRREAERTARRWNVDWNGKTPHRVARLVVYEATEAEAEAWDASVAAEARPPAGEE